MTSHTCVRQDGEVGVDVITGWLVQVAGDSLLRSARDQRRMAQLIRAVIESVADQASPELRDEVRRGLIDCFDINRQAVTALDSDVPPHEALASAIRNQVGQLAQFRQTDPPPRMFLDAVPVDLTWLQDRMAESFIARLQVEYTSGGLDNLALGSWLSQIAANTEHPWQAPRSRWGSALFSLETLGEPPSPDADSSPSQWLLARHQVVPFGGQAAETERAAINRWLGGPRAGAARLLTGRGGQGKTRLAMQIADDARAADWHVVIARPTVDAPIPAADMDRDGPPRPADAQGSLVIVDYADRWQDDALQALLAHPDLAPGDACPVRVLLLARSGQFWPAFRDVLDQRGFADVRVQLPELAPDTPTAQEREHAYRAAYTTFSKRIRGCDGEPATMPDLSIPGYELVLAVHMAALAAVIATRDGDSTPQHPDDVSRYILDRERRHWRRIADRRQRTRGLGESVLPRVVLLASLVQRTTRRVAIDLLDRPELTGPAQDLLDIHGVCYPSTVRGAVLEPLTPDRLAEDFLAQTVDHNSSQHDPACSDLAQSLLAHPDESIAQASLTVVTESAVRHDALTRQLLIPTLKDRPARALLLSGSVLAHLMELPALEPVLLTAIRDALRGAIGASGVHTSYALGMAAAVNRLTNDQLTTENDPGRRASLLTEQSYWLAQAGRREDALAPAEEAVQIYRRLAQANPAAYEPDLASVVEQPRRPLFGGGPPRGRPGPGRGGRPDLPAAGPGQPRRLRTRPRHVVEQPRQPAIRRWAAARTPWPRPRRPSRSTGGWPRPTPPPTNPTSPRVEQPRHPLSEVGRREDALAPAEEAVQIRRRLAQANPAAYEPDLARSLNNLGTCYSEVGRREDALAPAEEAAQIYRRLAQANPAAYEPDLASALNNLGTCYSEVGRREDALAPAEEAVQIRRRLAQANPAAYEPDLAMSLNNLGIRYSGVGRREDALAPAEEAAQIYRRLAQANPAAYEPDLAMSLNNLGTSYSEVGRREDALAPAEEAVQIYRRLAQANPAAYEPALASVVEQPRHRPIRRWAAARTPWPRPRRPSRSTGGWPRPTPPPTNPTSPCR